MTKFIEKDVPCCYWINAVWLHSVSNISHHHAHINKCIMSSQYNDFSCVFSVLYKNHIDKTSYYRSSHFIWPTWILTCHNNSELFYQGWSLHSVAMYWYNGSTVTLGSNPVTQLCVSCPWSVRQRLVKDLLQCSKFCSGFCSDYCGNESLHVLYSIHAVTMSESFTKLERNSPWSWNVINYKG